MNATETKTRWIAYHVDCEDGRDGIQFEYTARSLGKYEREIDPSPFYHATSVQDAESGKRTLSPLVSGVDIAYPAVSSEFE